MSYSRPQQQRALQGAWPQGPRPGSKFPPVVPQQQASGSAPPGSKFPPVVPQQQASGSAPQSRKSSYPAPRPPQQAASGSSEWDPVVPDFFGHQEARASVQDYDPWHDDGDDAPAPQPQVTSGWETQCAQASIVLGGLRGDLEVLGRVWGG